MGSINVKIIHPTNNSDIDVGIPEETILEDVFSQLIDASFLSRGQSYSGVLRSTEGRNYDAPLDNSKTVLENGIANNDTIVTVLSTQAGCGFVSFTTLWQSIYPYLDQLGTVLGIAGTAVGIGVWIKRKFSQRYSPDEFISLVTSKELWNSHELSMKLAITNEEAKDLLKGLGYKWNRTFAMFVKTDRTIEILEAINDNLKQ